MQNFTFYEKLQIMFKVFKSSPLFVVCLFIAIFLLIFYAIMIILNKKINKAIFFSIWGVLLVMMVVKYNKVLSSLFDNLFDNIFMALYFPNLAVYIVILIISNVMFVYSTSSKRVRKSYKLINTFSALIIDTFLVLIVDIVNKNNINVHDEINVYTNPSLLVLLELTTAIFVSWLLLNLLITAKHKLEKYDKKKYPEMPEIIFD